MTDGCVARTGLQAHYLRHGIQNMPLMGHRVLCEHLRCVKGDVIAPVQGGREHVC